VFRLQLLAAAAAEDDEVILEALTDTYRAGIDNWRPIYQEMLDTHKLRLRPGVTIDDMVSMMAGAAEGLALRAISDPNSTVLDHVRRRSLLGNWALAFFASCTQAQASSDTRTLEQVVQTLHDG
jgi:hypothetical protein